MNSKLIYTLFLFSSLLAGTTISYTSLVSTAGQEKPLLVPKSGGLVTEEEITDDSTGLVIDPPREESDATSNEEEREYVVKIPPKLLELGKIKDPVKKLEFIFQDLEKDGKVPPKTTQTMMAAMNGDRDAIVKMCNVTENNCGIEVGSDNSEDVSLPDWLKGAIGWIVEKILVWVWGEITDDDEDDEDDDDGGSGQCIDAFGGFC